MYMAYAILIWILTSSLIENRIQLHTTEIMNLKFMAAIVPLITLEKV